MLRLKQDFLTLEIYSGGFKYLYSGFDRDRPEILDHGRIEFETSEWTELFVSLNQALKELIGKRMPSFKHLRTYLVPPPEMTVATAIVYPELDRELPKNHRQWEIRQTLPGDDGEFQTICTLPRKSDNPVLKSEYCLAIRDSHLARFNEILQTRGLVASGMFSVQQLFRQYADGLPSLFNEGIILLRDPDYIRAVFFQSRGYPVIKQKPIASSASAGDFRTGFLNQDLSVYSASSGFTERLPVYILKDNFDAEQCQKLKDELGLQLNTIDKDDLPQSGEIGFEAEYLTLLLAHREIEKIYA
ncbi:MAG: hypothetical protein GF404_00845 [candidate division Zixibacteria bacterium]|nr:hypothetical protein [candidate division Zixibacteria bacterium]